MRETLPQISSARPVENERQVNVVRYACAGIVFMLMATFLCTIISARIYRFGILMYGQKPGFRQLIKLVRMQ